jgi:hypothetical protein
LFVGINTVEIEKQIKDIFGVWFKNEN